MSDRIFKNKKLNCWEHMDCKHRPGKGDAFCSDMCPAVTGSTFSGINSGVNAGRFCWAVAGSFSQEKPACQFIQEGNECTECEFYQTVRAEEGTEKIRSTFLKFVFSNSSVMKHMKSRSFSKGEYIFRQGEQGGDACLIQSGSCLILVEKDGVLHPVDHRNEGDLVDMMSLFTGEPRHGSAIAETDMDVWMIGRKIIHKISEKDPDLLDFLSEMVADRFDSKRPVADRIIGRYMATGIVGRGGFSIVYLGKHRYLEMPVVIKMMRHNLAIHSDFLENFRKEAIITAGFNHENIARVFDIEERFNTIFMIMEYLEGDTLEEVLKGNGNLTHETIVTILIQILSGLNYAHKYGILHRDINPSNIFIQDEGPTKLIDFGFACPIGMTDEDEPGTIAYVSPEQLEAESVDQRTDIYSLGLTAYEMVTGEKPVNDDDLSRLIRLRLSDEIPDPALLCPDIPEGLQKFIVKSTKINPGDRYSNTDEVLPELKETLRKLKQTKHLPDNHEYITLSFQYHQDHKDKIEHALNQFQSELEEIGADVNQKES